MTETEWLTCTEPDPMLRYLWGKVEDRKLRLFACACCRRIWPLLANDSRRAVEAAERFADDKLNKQELHIAFTEAASAVQGERGNPAYVSPNGSMGGPATAAYAAAFSGIGGYGAADAAAGCVVRAATASGSDEATEKTRQADLLREIVGPHPFRLVIAPAAVHWNDALAVRLAQVAYDERHLPSGTLDNGRLAVLADALEEVGCTDAEILGHLRGPGPHVRGCWPVDLFLGKS